MAQNHAERRAEQALMLPQQRKLLCGEQAAQADYARCNIMVTGAAKICMGIDRPTG